MAKKPPTTPKHIAGPGPDIANLAACTEDARLGALDTDAGPADPLEYGSLPQELDAAAAKFPPLYQQDFVDPFAASIRKLGQSKFNQILIGDPDREQTAGLMLDMAQAVLQRADGYQHAPTNGFQEVVSDLYDGFLSAEDRRGIKPPDRATTPPLVKWGNPMSGPYTWPVDATTSFGARAAVVNLPPGNARKGLMAWAALAHETSGHDVSHANVGLQDEMAQAVRAQVEKATPGLGDYWAARIDETSSDVMGILNMGPAPGIGLIAYFRGLNAAFSGTASLRNDGPESDPHPADIVRGYLAAATVSLLNFSQATTWAAVISSQTDKDVTAITLEGQKITTTQAKASAKAAASAIATTKFSTLGGHALSEIQNWNDSDEVKVAKVRPLLKTAADFSPILGVQIYAAHVVAAACMEALSGTGDIAVVFPRMIAALDALFDKNPSWGPLLVRHPGDIARDYIYRRAA
jgi:hypothetical protein